MKKYTFLSLLFSVLILCLIFYSCSISSEVTTPIDGGNGNTGGDTTAPTASVSPVSGSAISSTTSVIITFNESMDKATLVLGGNMASESDGGIWSSKALFFITSVDDTLTISPSTAWTGGSGRTLTVDCDDLAGNPLSTLSLSYTVDLTLPTATESPNSGSTIGGDVPIVITFSESMDTGTLNLGGEIASESDGGIWSTTTIADDTLTISPSVTWTSGSGRSLTVDCDDLMGNSLSTIVLNYKVLSTSIELVTISSAGDSFIMGDGTLGPDVSQTITYNFEISKYEITNGQFAQFIADGGYSNSSYWTTNGWAEKTSEGWTQPKYWTDSNFNGMYQPVIGISWYEAVAFCNWLSEKEGLTQAYNSAGQADIKASGYRLPTQVEWEYAAAKGSSIENERIYAYGDTWDENKLVHSVPPTVTSKTMNVGSKSPTGDTPQGLTDMSGNVAEWCSDNYEQFIYSGTDRYYFVDDQTSTYFICYNGSWNSVFKSGFRCANYAGRPSYTRGNFLGFRVVCPSPSPGTLTVTVNYASASDGGDLSILAYDGETKEILAMTPEGTTFSGGSATATLVTIDTGTTKTFNPGSYILLILVDANASGGIDIGEPVTIQSVDIDGDTDVEFDETDFASSVGETIIVTSSTVPDGGMLAGYWLLPGSPLVTDPFTVQTSPPPGFITFSMTLMPFSDGAVTTILNFPIAPGTYDLSIYIDSDNDGTVNTGDYLFLIQDVTIDGSGTDITDDLAGVTPIE